MSTIYDVLKRPILTEKSSHQYAKLHQFVFEVSRDANKTMVKDAIETIFDVRVLKVNVVVAPAKRSRRARSRRLSVRRSSYKKAIVTLHPDDTIDAFEGVR